MIAKGGTSVYGAEIGILMLEARFPRIVGDMGIEEADTVVELGPGTGAFTDAILERQSAGSRSDAAVHGVEIPSEAWGVAAR